MAAFPDGDNHPVFGPYIVLVLSFEVYILGTPIVVIASCLIIDPLITSIPISPILWIPMVWWSTPIVIVAPNIIIAVIGLPSIVWYCVADPEDSLVPFLNNVMGVDPFLLV